MYWGLLGPEELRAPRRTRTLGIGAAVRRFNDLAVPGMGGVWFSKQLMLPLLGVALGERSRQTGRQLSNIEAANSIEAIACWLSFDRIKWSPDSRLLGRQKMRSKMDLSFKTVRQSSFYVTQPMRMRAVQPLLALGLVNASGERFNAFECSELGNQLLDLAFGAYRPKNRTVLDNLLSWVSGDTECVKTHSSRDALSPLTPTVEPALEFLNDCLIAEGRHGAGQRKASLAWVQRLRVDIPGAITWDKCPPEIVEGHWRDLRAGAFFFTARDIAINLLDELEANLVHRSAGHLDLACELPEHLSKAVSNVQQAAKAFLAEQYDPSPDGAASNFCNECAHPDPSRAIQALVKRDEHVLRLRDTLVIRGPASRDISSQFTDQGGAEPEEGEPSSSTEIQWPRNISRRVSNLFLLNADLHGALPTHIGTKSEILETADV